MRLGLDRVEAILGGGRLAWHLMDHALRLMHLA